MSDPTVTTPSSPPAPPALSPGATAAVAALLLGIYAAPALGMIVALFRTQLATRESWYFQFFFTLATTNGDVMTEIHQLLLPLLSLFSIATFRQLASRHLLWLGAAVLLSFLAVVGLEIWLGTDQLKFNLKRFTVSDDQFKAADGMLRRMRESQMMYLAIVIGLRVPGGARDDGQSREAKP